MLGAVAVCAACAFRSKYLGYNPISPAPRHHCWCGRRPSCQGSSLLCVPYRQPSEGRFEGVKVPNSWRLADGAGDEERSCAQSHSRSHISDGTDRCLRIDRSPAPNRRKHPRAFACAPSDQCTVSRPVVQRRLVGTGGTHALGTRGICSIP